MPSALQSGIRWLLLLSVLLTTSGCGIIDYFFLPVPEDTAQELYEIGAEAMKEKDYYTAIHYFSTLKDRYPFSPYTPQAELSLADAYFLNTDYMEAMEAYQEFEAMHPRHQEMPYVLLQIGVSAYNSFQSIDKPQDQIGEGLQYLYRLRESYPGTEQAQIAEEYILKLRRILAEREIFVADFYWRAERYGPAWKRYQFVTDNFSDLEDLNEYAMRKGQLSYLRYQKQEAQVARDVTHGSWKLWFRWL